MTNWEEKLTKVLLRIDLILLFIPDELEGVRDDIQRARSSLMFCAPETAHLFTDEVVAVLTDLVASEYKTEPWLLTVLTIWAGQKVESV